MRHYLPSLASHVCCLDNSRISLEPQLLNRHKHNRPRPNLEFQSGFCIFCFQKSWRNCLGCCQKWGFVGKFSPMKRQHACAIHEWSLMRTRLYFIDLLQSCFDEKRSDSNLTPSLWASKEVSRFVLLFKYLPSDEHRWKIFMFKEKVSVTSCTCVHVHLHT